MSESREQRDAKAGRLRRMIMDDDQCFAAVQSRDPRFDGWFVLGVTTTGIYCRPSSLRLQIDAAGRQQARDVQNQPAHRRRGAA